MTSTSLHKQRPLAAAIGILLALPVQALPVDWIGGTGFWDVSGNWNSGLPTAIDDVLINVPGTHTVTISSGSNAVNSINVTGDETLAITGGSLAVSGASTLNNFSQYSGNLTGTGNVNLNGTANWTGGTQSGSGTTTVNGALLISGNYDKYLSGRTLTNNGTTTWQSDYSYFNAGNGATINNNGTWLDQSGNNYQHYLNANGGGAAASFNNNGSYTKSGYTATFLGIAFNNAGTVNVDEGALYFSAGGNSSAGSSFNIANNAYLGFNGGTYNLSDLTTVTGAGNLLIAGATVNTNGTLDTTSTVNISSGNLTGTGTVNLNGTANWTGGTQSGSGTTTVNGALLISGNYDKYLSGRTLTNNGTTTWQSDYSYFNAGNGATINNNGTWLDQSGNNYQHYLNANGGGAAASFNNNGSYTKSGYTATFLGIAFNNAGTVNVDEGALYFSAGGNSSAGSSFNIANNAYLGFNGGTYNLSDLTTVTGAGNLLIAGATVNTNGTLDTTSTVNISSGNLTGTGTVNLNGTANWTGGTQSGSGTTTVNGALLISGNYDKYLSGRTLTNNGTTTWQSDYSYFNAGNGATINNNGTWLDQSGNNYQHYLNANGGGAAASFNNNGSYTKSGYTATFLGIAFNNAGTVNVDEGALYFSAGGNSSAGSSFNIANNAYLGFNGGTYNLSDLTTVTGAGNLLIAGATVNTNGTLDTTSTVNISSGNLTGTGTVNLNGTANWTGGTQSGSGTTTVNGALLISGNYDKYLSGRTLTNNGTTTWQSDYSYFNAGNGATINNNGTWLDQSGNNYQHYLNANGGGAAASFNNNGSYTKSGYTATFLGIAFNNAGTVNVDEGALYFSAGGNSSAGSSFNIANNAYLGFNGGTYNLSDLTTVTGAGNLLIAGATVNTNGTLDTTSTVNISSGNLTGTGTVNLNGTANWTGGTQSGSGTTTVNGALLISGNYDKYLSGRTLTNNGTTTWQSDYSYFNAGNGATINNNGTWLDQSGNNYQHYLNANGGGAAASFNNNGTYTKSGNTGTFIGIAFNNTGTGVVNVDGGALYLSAPVTNQGSISVSSGATVSVQNATFTNQGTLQGSGTYQTLNANTALVNAGTLAPGVNGIGTLTISGDYTQTTSGFFDIQLSSLTSYDKLDVLGDMDLSGGLRIYSLGGFDPIVGNTFTIATFDDGVADLSDFTGIFSNIVWSGFNPGVSFTASYFDHSIVLNATAAPVPIPAAAWLFGSGMLGLIGYARRKRVTL